MSHGPDTECELQTADRLFGFSLATTSGSARAGRFQTPHGSFDTPAFMPVGTHGAVKAMTPEQVRATGAQILLANTYHLSLRPGESLVAKLGGLHEFIRWSGPILTDSGGFQVFSLPNVSISDRGARFANEAMMSGHGLSRIVRASPVILVKDRQVSEDQLLPRR